MKPLVHLLSLRPGERFALATALDAGSFTVVEAAEVLEGEKETRLLAASPDGLRLSMTDVAIRNGNSYFVRLLTPGRPS